jgi:hypothetical protein
MEIRRKGKAEAQLTDVIGSLLQATSRASASQEALARSARRPSMQLPTPTV